MNVTLLFHSPLWLASHAIRMSHDSHDKSDTEFVVHGSNGYKEKLGITGDKDKLLIERIGNKLKHKSVLEQLVYWFDIDGISRACLQELARHRTARLTVKSSRYTLKELIDAPSMWYDFPKDCDWDTGYKFIVKTGNDILDGNNILMLGILQNRMRSGLSNDIAKYCLPEAFKTRLQWQIDGRNLQNFLELRTSKDALWEIRILANKIFQNLPEEHKYLYSEYIKEN